MKSGLNHGKAESHRMREEERIHLFVKEQPVKVVCYNCHQIINKDEAVYLPFFDTYFCESCYLRLLDGKSVRLSNWRKRGV